MSLGYRFFSNKFRPSLLLFLSLLPTCKTAPNTATPRENPVHLTVNADEVRVFWRTNNFICINRCNKETYLNVRKELTQAASPLDSEAVTPQMRLRNLISSCASAGFILGGDFDRVFSADAPQANIRQINSTINLVPWSEETSPDEFNHLIKIGKASACERSDSLVAAMPIEKESTLQVDAPEPGQ